MKEKPILFSGPMVRAILEGRKTQTRRLFKGRDYRWWQACGGEIGDEGLPVAENSLGDPVTIYGPYQIGDILWVRERHAMDRDQTTVIYRADPMFDDCKPGDFAWKWRPSIHMPRWASRITLEVTEVRAQRLQDITEEDAKAEGADVWPYDPMQPMTTGELGGEHPYRGGFAVLWDAINDHRATWNSNPWVWVYAFRRVTPATVHAEYVEAVPRSEQLEASLEV